MGLVTFSPSTFDEKNAVFVDSSAFCISHEGLTWNPPKPKTISIDILLDDAEAFLTESQTFKEVSERLNRVEAACRKALKQLEQ